MSSPDADPLADIELLLDRLDKLHSSPAVAIELMELTRDPDYNVDDLLKCLYNDPPLTATVLRLANSSYYGAVREIASVRQALTYLGRGAIRLAAIGFGLMKGLTHGTPNDFHQMYWQRSLTMAAAARKLAQRTGDALVDPEVAFTGGLMADLGMVVLAQLEAEKYLPLCDESDHVAGQIALERDNFRFDHVDVGTRLLSRWQMPTALVDAVASHHHCPSDAPHLNQVVYAANLLAEVLWTPDSPHMKPLVAMLDTHFSMNVDDLITLSLECKDAVRESVDLFQVRLSDEFDVDAIQRESQRLFESVAFEIAGELDGLFSIIGDDRNGK